MNPNPPPRPVSPFLAGLVAMAMATVLAFAWRLGTGQLTPAEVVEGQFVLTIPGNLFEVGISALGPWAKRILLLLFVVGQILLGGGIASVLDRWRRLALTTSSAALTSLARSAGTAFLVGGGIAMVLGGPEALGRSVAILAFIGLAYAGAREAVWIAAGELMRAPARVGVIDGSAVTPSTLSRRKVLALAAGTTAAGVAVAAVGGINPRVITPSDDLTGEFDATPIPEAQTVPLAASVTDDALIVPAGVTPDITSNADFYQVSQAVLSDPGIDLSTWKLPITGLVTRSVAFTLDDLRALPAVERQHTLTCVSNQVGGNLISNAVWTGARLADVLGRVGIKAGVHRVVLHGADFYEDSITIERALDPESLVVYAMNGVPLPTQHGFPLRLLVPNIYGMKNVKWIVGIELVSHEFVGTWQRGGWSNSAPIKTMSRIDLAGPATIGQPVTVGGIAFGGQRGISAVELSADAGRTWIPARVKHLNRANVWTQWVASLTPTAPGLVKLLVRATDGRGERQIQTYAAPFPAGSSGWQGVDVFIS